MKVGHKLQLLMAIKGIKHLTNLADEAKVSYKKLYLFANNKDKFFDPELIAKVCVALDCELGELLYLEKEDKS